MKRSRFKHEICDYLKQEKMYKLILSSLLAFLVIGCKTGLNKGLSNPNDTYTKSVNQLDIGHNRVLSITEPALKINMLELGESIDVTFKDLDSINNLDIPYFYKGKYLSASVRQGNDSVYFQPKEEKDIQVKVRFNGETKIINLIFIESPSARFSRQYIEKHQNTITTELPELYELINVAIAITKFNSDSNYKVNPNNEINFMINKKTDYHKKIITTFSKFNKHPLITFLDNQFAEDFNRYHLFTANAYCLMIEHQKVHKKRAYASIWMGKSYFNELIPLIEDFYKKTKFQQFYSENRAYYNQLISDFEGKGEIKDIHIWLENISGIHYESFKYILSSLVYGGHKTQNFSQDNFKECLIFLPPFNVKEIPDIKEIIRKSKLEFTGVVFTEVDHNYVNPIADKYKTQIEESIKDLKVWNIKHDQGHYPSKLSTFNEYITHALFLLYAKEKFQPEDYSEMKKFWIAQEANPHKRCFVKFGEFYEQLEKDYNQQTVKNEKYNLEQSMVPILNWMSGF